MEAGLLISFPGGDDNCRLIFWMRCFGLGPGKEGLCLRWWLPMTPIFSFRNGVSQSAIVHCSCQYLPLAKNHFFIGGTAKITDMQMHLR